MNICLNNLYLSVCVTQFFVSIRMARFVQGKWFQNLYGLYVSITRSCISANGSSEWFVFVMKKVFCYQPLVLYCDINHFQWDTKCMICLISNIFDSIFSAFFQEIHFRFFSVWQKLFSQSTLIISNWSKWYSRMEYVNGNPTHIAFKESLAFWYKGHRS